MHWYILEEQVA